MFSTANQETGEIYSVSQLTSETRQLLESHFSILWIEGEISNFSVPSSGHWYFTLKDDKSQIRCAMFRMQNRLTHFIPKDGQKVLLRARVSLYEGRGDFQLIAEYMEENGLGALQRAFEALKRRLAQEGLFDKHTKKSLPSFVHCIGVITSPTGAAIHDIITTLKRRFPGLPVIIYPTAVQGVAASLQIAEALQTANVRRECDLIILARGGGSLEDLWPFNEEIVARAIFASDIPIITGIGHETDFTIADFVADARAPTPTAAAEMSSPDSAFWLHQFEQLQLSLTRLIEYKLQQSSQSVDNLTKRLINPRRYLENQRQQLIWLTSHLMQIHRHSLQQQQARLNELAARLRQVAPSHLLSRYQQENTLLRHRLIQGMEQLLQQCQHKLQQNIYGLDTLSPLATLKRGFAIVTDDASQEILRSTNETAPGRKIRVTLAEGHLQCEIEKVFA